jgi:hypothetical protein
MCEHHEASLIFVDSFNLVNSAILARAPGTCLMYKFMVDEVKLWDLTSSMDFEIDV